jgi:hypothetical protein
MMARKEGREPGRTGGLLHRFALIPALVMVAVDARRRPIWATIGYAATLFVVLGWLMASRPSLAPMVPSAAVTVGALALTLAAALGGGIVARWLSDSLARAAA